MLSLHYSALLLMIFVPVVQSVCNVCYGHAEGCGGQANACPWNVQVAQNVAVLAAGTGAALSLTTLLPTKVLRIFSKTVLDSISALVIRSVGPYDFNGKTASQVLSAVRLGKVSKDDARIILSYTF